MSYGTRSYFTKLHYANSFECMSIRVCLAAAAPSSTTAVGTRLFQGLVEVMLMVEFVCQFAAAGGSPRGGIIAWPIIPNFGISISSEREVEMTGRMSGGFKIVDKSIHSQKRWR